MKALLRSVRSAVLALAAGTLAAIESAGRWFSSTGDDVLFGGTRWLLSYLARNPESHQAAAKAWLTVAQVVRPHRELASFTISTSVLALLAGLLLPPLMALLIRPRARVFVSFHHSREADAAALQQAMERAGIATLRMPYRADASHQAVVDTPIDGIRRCHLFVGLPGPAASFVDHEVYAATALEKPIAFVVSEASGSLPNSADKRYPVFRLEALRSSGHAPLVQFLRHVAGDVRSTLAVVGDALRHPAVSLSAAWMTRLAVVAVLVLLVICLTPVWAGRSELLGRFPAHADEARGAMAVAAVLLFLLALLAFGLFAYAALVLGRLSAQVIARRRMRRASAAAAFRREDWIGLLPGLTPGEALYESLFETAPRAHHETDGVAPSGRGARPGPPATAARRRRKPAA